MLHLEKRPASISTTKAFPGNSIHIYITDYRHALGRYWQYILHTLHMIIIITCNVYNI
jgi:hypothetical protein